MMHTAIRKDHRSPVRAIQPLPHDFLAGFLAERPEILDAICRPLTAEECQEVATCMATLLMTVHDLADRTEAMEDTLDNIRVRLDGIRAEHRNIQSRINGVWLVATDPEEELDEEELDDEDDDEIEGEDEEEEEGRDEVKPVTSPRPAHATNPG